MSCVYVVVVCSVVYPVVCVPHSIQSVVQYTAVYGLEGTGLHNLLHNRYLYILYMYRYSTGMFNYTVLSVLYLVHI